jgi:hypothetical protein
MDAIVVGSGAAGLQWGILLQAMNTTYTIVEAESGPGSFFTKYPRSRRLISHNRCNFGIGIEPEFMLRHDWHSLLRAPLTFCDFLKRHNHSQEFYPHADVYVAYLKDIAKHLNILYLWEASSISYAENDVTVCNTQEECIRAKHVIIATGMQPRKTNFTTVDYGNYPDLDPITHSADFCRGKRIGVIGGGNAAVETANMLAACAQSVHVYTSRPSMFAGLTHYPGNVRMQYMSLFDRYMLKTLDTLEVLTGDMNQIGCYDKVDCSGGTIDTFVYCGGFASGRNGIISDMDASTKYRFPLSDPFYKVRNSFGRGWYSGVIMHGKDYKLSSGGFVHGFRYLVQSQFRFMIFKDTHAWENELFGSKNAMITKAIERMQISFGLYQMQHVLCDLILFQPKEKKFVYLEEVPFKDRHDILRAYESVQYCAFLFAYHLDNG